jgi:hypothetical protein
MYFVFIYDSRTMKPVEIVLKKGEEERDEEGGSKSDL